MYRRFHERFGTAGVIIAVIALVAALSGTALAAKGALTGKQRKEVEKIAKKYAGKPGAPGAAGLNGTNGTNGKDGASGANGENGSDGAPGDAGADGKSIEALGSFEGADEVPANEGPCLGAGGSEYEVEDSGSPEIICNGKQGEKGDPWSPNSILPKGATETGSWALNGTAGNVSAVRSGVYVPLSFPVRLAAPIAEGMAFYVTPAETGEPRTSPAECPGNVNVPKAAEGALCVYVSSGFSVENATFDKVVNVTDAENNGASRFGALIHFKEVSDGAYGGGSWAVTAP